jgi:hypothetical protein
MNTNLPLLKSSGCMDSSQIKGLPLYLVEYSNAPHVTTILPSPTDADEEAPQGIMEVRGLRLHCVYNTDCQIVTQYDANEDKTPLAFLTDIPEAIFASARPTDTGKYQWQLSLVRGGEAAKEGLIMMIGTRLVDADEEAALDRTFINWREFCKAFDEKLAFEERQAQLNPAVPTPTLTNISHENESPIG